MGKELMRKFTTFDNELVKFFEEHGIKCENSFKGRNGDTGYDYGYIPNLKGLLNEYRSTSSKEVKKDSFEKILNDFLVISKAKIKECEREHTKSDRNKKKKINAKRRKDNNG